MVKPLRTINPHNEKPPLKPLRPWLQPPDTYKYKVTTGDTWETLGARNDHEFGANQLIWINFRLNGTEPFYTDHVNWYLRNYVGCKWSLDGGRNWAFTDDADPGYIFLPFNTYKFDAIAITGSRGLGGVSAPQYSDEDAYDEIEHALDIYGAADMGINMLEIPIPELVEAGMILLGPFAALVAEGLALGSPYHDVFKYWNREYFFGGFCSSFVMTADGWSVETVERFYPPLEYPPLNSAFPEKSETFRKLYNFGLKAGLLQGSRTNRVDRRNLFVLLRSRLTYADAQSYSGDVKEWSEPKKKNYYDLLAGILKEIMKANNLQVTLR